MHCISCHIKRLAALGLSLLMLLSCFGIYAAAAEQTSAASTADVSAQEDLAEGYYRIRNLGTGKYLDTYDLLYDPKGTAYLDKSTGQNGQDFLVTRLPDGNYTIVGQSDGAKYALSYSSGSYLTKRANPAQTETFEILPFDNGAYLIIPAYSENSLLVLTASSDKTYHGYNYIISFPYIEDATQYWVFEPVPVTKISLAYTQTRERLWSIGKFYAALSPYPSTALNMTWTSDNEEVLMIDNTGEYCTIGVGVANVTVTCGDVSATVRVEVHDSDTYAYFSQHNITNSYWNGSALSGIYFTAGVRKRYAIDRYNQNSDWMDEGCALTANAMLLRNLGATLTEGYDFRSGQTNNLPADPYTVSLANTGNYGATSANATLYGNPILVNHNLIATRFRVNGKALSVTQYYYPSLKQIKEALDEHPEGVVVGMRHAVYGSHYFLFTECVNPDETNPNKYKFKVCDPAAYTLSQGDNIPFEQSYSYLSLGYRYSCVTCMLVWDVEA